MRPNSMHTSLSLYFPSGLTNYSDTSVRIEFYFNIACFFTALFPPGNVVKANSATPGGLPACPAQGQRSLPLVHISQNLLPMPEAALAFRFSQEEKAPNA